MIGFGAWAGFHFPKAILGAGPDDSWSVVLGYAREHRMQFGRDIVFTYGPLGFLSIEFFQPYEIVARIFFEVALGFGISTGVGLLAWRMSLPWRIATLVFFIFVSLPTHWGGDALLLDAALFAWGLLCFLESGKRLRFYAAALAALAAIAALVKFTFLLEAVFTITLVAGDFALRGRRAAAGGLLAGFLAAFGAIWILLGQNPGGLGAFLVNSYAVATGYNAAMGLQSVSLEWIILMAAFAMAAVLAGVLPGQDQAEPRERWRRSILMAWLAGLVFQSWKYGCIRSDYNHVMPVLGFMPFLALSIAAVPGAGKWRAKLSRACALGSVAAAFVFLHVPLPGFFPATLVRHTLKNLGDSFRVVCQPDRYIREKNAASEAAEKNFQLPKIRAAVGGATVDVFGQNQALALFNRLDYRPRPVFQTYSAYNRRLMQLNERFYLSEPAPEYVLFNLSPLDERFAPLEDAWALRDILANYELVLSEGDYLLLRRKATAAPRLTLAKEGVLHAGEKLDLRDYTESSLWLEIEAQPSLFGRFEQFFYKVPPLRLALWSRSDLSPGVTFVAPAAMLSAGFLAGPVALDTTDVRALYTGGRVRRADAYSLESSPGLNFFWKPEIHFRLYTIENQPAPGAPGP